MLQAKSGVRVFAIVALLAITACGSQTVPDEPADMTRAPLSGVSSFEVTISPAASLHLADNPGFDLNAFRAAIERALSARKLLFAQGDAKLIVLVDEVRVRAEGASVTWGVVGDDHVYGTATLRGRDGKSTGSFAVEVSLHYDRRPPPNITRAAWINERFAQVLADGLVERRDAER